MLSSKKLRMPLMLAALLLTFTACSQPSPPSYPEIPTPDIATLQPSAVETATDLPLPASAASKEKLTKSLSALLSFNQSPSTEDIKAYLVEEGIVEEDLQISKTTTPTGLSADAVEIGWVSGGECIMGYIREGASSVAVLPVLPNGKCFIGVSYE